MNRISVILILLFFTFAGSSFAQDQEIKTDFQSWTDLTLKYRFSQRLTLGGDLGTRGIWSDRDWNSFYIRPKLRFIPSQRIRIDGGFAYFFTNDEFLGKTDELRFYQDFTLVWPDLGWAILAHRIRFEERLLYYESGDNDQKIRGRYRLGMETIDFDLFKWRNAFYLKAMFEGFIPLGASAEELFVNRQRYHVGIGHRFSERFRLEMQYFWQQSRALSEDGFITSENILRFRFFYDLNILNEIDDEREPDLDE